MDNIIEKFFHAFTIAQQYGLAGIIKIFINKISQFKRKKVQANSVYYISNRELANEEFITLKTNLKIAEYKEKAYEETNGSFVRKTRIKEIKFNINE